MVIAICDDDFICRELIMNWLNTYFHGKSICYEFIQYQNGINLIDDIEEGRWIDLIFLDIYIDDILGINAAKKLRQLKYNGQIIFITSTPDYAIDSYEVDATGYLIKPLEFEKVAQSMDKILKKISINTYRVKKYSKIINIPYDEIVYIESNNSKCILHRNDKTSYVVYKKLTVIENELKDNRFLRCHQSYLVNMNYIQQADKQFTLTTGDIVLIRQRTLKSIKQHYIDYISSKGSLQPLDSNFSVFNKKNLE